MDNAISLKITYDCGLRIEVFDSEFKGIDHTQSNLPWKYKVTNHMRTDIAYNLIPQELLYGCLSPTSPLTLDPMSKNAAGVPLEATSYGFMYPPQLLAEKIMSDHGGPEAGCRKVFESDDITNLQGIISAITLGGYAYFDKDFKCIRINALSNSANKSSRTKLLMFSGPFKVNQSLCAELYNTGRTHPLRLDTFREVGFIRFAWARSNETFMLKPVSYNFENNHGAFLFFHENGTIVAFVVDPIGCYSENADVGLISEAFGNISKAKFNQKPSIQFKVNTTRLAMELEDGSKTILHKACYEACSKEDMVKLLSIGGTSNLSYQDEFGWNPLHYACRFSPSDCGLISLLTEKCPVAAMQLDHFGRYPLHILCDSNDTSKDAITAMLHADTSDPKITITKKTQTCRLLPLHFACYKGAPDCIIRALLDADKNGVTAIQPTEFGDLPLHLAIRKKLPGSILKMLLDENFFHHSKKSKSKFYDIYQRSKGMLPLHLACYNDSSIEIIEMLLEKDIKNFTIDNIIDANLGGKADKHRLLPNERVALNEQLFMPLKTEEGTTPLHLATEHGSKDIIRLLLRKEIEKAQGCRLFSLYVRDSRGRTPLHIAFEHNKNPCVIRWLLELDTLKENTQVDDKKGFRPMHYACKNKNIDVKVFNHLCDAEEQYNEYCKLNDKPQIRSSHCTDHVRNKTPLYLALEAGAPKSVVEKLMQPGNFNLHGFDNFAMEALVDIVKDSEAVQEQVICTLSDRLHFSLIYTELCTSMWALLSLVIGSQQLVDGNITLTWPHMLTLCSFVFIAREILQLWSVGINYIGDKWSWIELGCIICLLTTAHHMVDQVGRAEVEPKRQVLCLTGSLLTLQVLGFLRSTFLPFARFVGGLLEITRSLLPFLVVSLLLLGAFIYSFWMRKDPNCNTFATCSKYIILGSIFGFEPSEDAGTLELFLFGVLIIIVLLNVVIAIVCEAWERASEQSIKIFWHSRLNKLHQLHILHKIKIDKLPQKIDNILQKIDNMEKIAYRNIGWAKEPYNHVTEEDQYKNPYKYFHHAISKKIHDAKSLQANIYWAEMEVRNKYMKVRSIDMEVRRTDMEGVKLDIYSKLKCVADWIIRCIVYILIIGLGSITFGLLFPKNLRSGILSLGVGEVTKKEGEVKKNDQMENMKNETI